MEDRCRDQAEGGQGIGHQAGLKTDDDGDATQQFQRDRRPQQDRRHAHGLHVSCGARRVSELAEAGPDENDGQKDAAGEVGILVHGFSPLGLDRVLQRRRRRPDEFPGRPPFGRRVPDTGVSHDASVAMDRGVANQYRTLHATLIAINDLSAE